MKRIIFGLQILFCAIFLMLCAFPIFKLDPAKVSWYENRDLAKFPTFWENGRLGDDLSKRLEDYLKDHFPWRLKLIKFYFHFQYAFLSRIENQQAFVGDDGWMFGFWPTRDNRYFVQEWIYSNDEKNIIFFLQEAQKRSKDVYFFLVPERAQIYHQYWDKIYAWRPYMRAGDKVKELAAKYSGVEVFYPYEQLEALSKKNVVFLKNDIHLYGEEGLQPLVETFMQILQKKYFPDAESYPKVKYGQGQKYHAHYAQILFLDQDRGGTIATPVSGEYLSHQDIVYDDMTDEAVNPSAVTDKRALVLGNCYAELLFAQLREVFSRTLLYRCNTSNKSQTEKKLSWDDIDVFIIAVASDNWEGMNFLRTVGEKL